VRVCLRDEIALGLSVLSFASAFAQLTSDLTSELRATGRADLARELEGCRVRDVSFDPAANAGLVTLEAVRELNVVERNVVGQRLSQVIPFSHAPYASLQLDNFGRIIGIELSAPPPALGALMKLISDNRRSGP
jgi:hypothetical protein